MLLVILSVGNTATIHVALAVVDNVLSHIICHVQYVNRILKRC